MVTTGMINQKFFFPFWRVGGCFCLFVFLIIICKFITPVKGKRKIGETFVKLTQCCPFWSVCLAVFIVCCVIVKCLMVVLTRIIELRFQCLVFFHILKLLTGIQYRYWYRVRRNAKNQLHTNKSLDTYMKPRQPYKTVLNQRPTTHLSSQSSCKSVVLTFLSTAALWEGLIPAWMMISILECFTVPTF